MNVLLVIDHFGSGGAQRQMVNLAIGLRKQGCEVDVFIYYPEFNFHRQVLEQNSVNIIDHYKEKTGISFSVFFHLRQILVKNTYDIALAYLDTPSVYLLFSGIKCKTKLIVSDRSSYLGAPGKYSYLIKRQIFRLAHKVITNSEMQKSWFVNTAGFPDNKIVTIYNGYDEKAFYIDKTFFPSNPKLKLIAIGGIRPVKNIETLILALDLFYQKHRWLPDISWVGKSDDFEYEMKVKNLLESKTEVKTVWKWMGERRDIPGLLATNHALISPSYYEGLPNVICEALFSGKPVLTSNVCDNPVLVEDNVRGFLFNPKSPESIMRSIESLVGLNRNEWLSMSKNCRLFAENNLSLDNMVSAYMTVFNSVLEKPD
ncbi:MAG: glycosyltransferase family 4 protein [Cyclobacteriaceae bacterium]